MDWALGVLWMGAGSAVDGVWSCDVSVTRPLSRKHTMATDVNEKVTCPLAQRSTKCVGWAIHHSQVFQIAGAHHGRRSRLRLHGSGPSCDGDRAENVAPVALFV